MSTIVPPQTVTFKIDKPTSNTAVPVAAVTPIPEKLAEPKPKLDDFFAKPVPNTVIPETTANTVIQPTPFFQKVQDKVAELNPPKKSGNGIIVFVVLLVAALFALYHYRAEVSQKLYEVVSHSRGNKDVHVANKNTIKVEHEQSAPLEEKRVRKEAKVLEARDYYLRIFNEDGSISVRTGGSLAWRINNPCRILYGKFSASQGAFDKADKFGVFKSYDAGRKACYELLFTSEHGYKQITVNDAMKRFAPESEGFKPITYVKALSKAGISSTVEMNDLSEAKRQKMIDVIMDVEVFIPGRVVEFESEADFNKRGY
tara:strand:- start:15197 stop:16138 length:942 start_codon:yes stop_codon:yes gene_type:complete